jgi:hypothetical protein
MNPRVNVDEIYDRENSSNRVSRYGVYLRQRAHWFEPDELKPMSPTAFAVQAWRIACSPVMSPGYVRLGPDVSDVTCRHADEPGLMVADIEVRLPWPHALQCAELTGGWKGWARSRDYDGRRPHLDPDDDRAALLFTVELRVPIRESDLPPAPSVGAQVDVADAKRSVAAVCRMVNDTAGPLVSALLASSDLRASR